MSIGLTIVDAKDGVHGTASVVGIGGAWVLYGQRPKGSPAIVTNGSGEGTFEFSVPKPGVYWFYLETDDERGGIVVGEITNGALSIDQQIAAKVLNIINSQVALPDACVARRKYVPGVKTEKLNKLHVTAICRTMESELADREFNNEVYIVEIGIQKKIDWVSDDDDEIDSDRQCEACDPWSRLTQSIRDAISNHDNSDIGIAEWKGIEPADTYEWQALLSREYKGLIAARYEIVR